MLKSASVNWVIPFVHAVVQVSLSQSTSGTITGLVTDPTGSAVPGAQIEARDLSNNRTLKAVSSASGSYNIPGLAPGLYLITVSLAGFKTAQVEKVEVRVAQTTTQNIVLEIGQLSESVTVTGGTELLSPSSAAVTTTVE